MDRSARGRGPGRRDFLGLVTAAGGACVLGVSTTGCGSGAPVDDAVAVPMETLDGERRVRVTWKEIPVEVVRDGDGVRAMSLLCTHFSCTVRWNESEGLYVCPCHQGRFDADGNPVSGPPQRPLDRVPVSVEGGQVWVGRG